MRHRIDLQRTMHQNKNFVVAMKKELEKKSIEQLKEIAPYYCPNYGQCKSKEMYDFILNLIIKKAKEQLS